MHTLSAFGSVLNLFYGFLGFDFNLNLFGIFIGMLMTRRLIVAYNSLSSFSLEGVDGRVESEREGPMGTVEQPVLRI